MNRPCKVLRDQIHNFRLLDSQVRLGFKHLPHAVAVLFLISLRARRPDGRAAAGVEQTKLDARPVYDLAHDAAERVHFADQMALGYAAHGRIARHLADEVEVDGVERGLKPHARRGHRRLAAGVARAYDHHIVFFCKACPHD